MKILNARFHVEFSYPVFFTRDVFAPENTVLAKILRSAGNEVNRVLVAVDSSVFTSSPDLAEKLAAYEKRNAPLMEFVDVPFIVRGGEICKNDPREVSAILSLTEKHHLCRHSFILAIGGGAVLDAVGFAAAIAHRGIRLIRMPTTTLSQCDAGVGVKNSVNAYGKKNYIGTFAPPYAVVCDFSFLQTLPIRDRRAGLAEAVKISLIKDADFFSFLYETRERLAVLTPADLERTIIRCAELHLMHINKGGDPFERGTGRPLDFGHWSAHAVEEITEGQLNHGEAVAIGITLDSIYACRMGWLAVSHLEKVITILRDLGFSLYHEALEKMDIARALAAFREHLGGELTLTMPHGIGKTQEIHTIDISLMKECLLELKERSGLYERESYLGSKIGRGNP